MNEGGWWIKEMKGWEKKGFFNANFSWTVLASRKNVGWGKNHWREVKLNGSCGKTDGKVKMSGCGIDKF